MCLAMPGKVEQLFNLEDPLLKSANVSYNGVIKRANITYLDDVKIGDYVIVHAGVALQILDEQSAIESIELFSRLSEQQSSL